MSQPEVQLKWYKTSGNLPANASTSEDPSLADDKKLAVFGDQLKDTDFPPSVTTWTQVSAAADTQLETDRQGRQGPCGSHEGPPGRC